MQFIIVTLDFFEEHDDNIEDGVCSTPKVLVLLFLSEAQIYFLSRSLFFPSVKESTLICDFACRKR